MTAYIIILLAVFCFAGQFAFTKLYESSVKQSTVTATVMLTVTGAIGAILFLFVGGFSVSFSEISVIYGVLFALVMIPYYIIGIKVLSLGSLAIYGMFMMLGGMLLPFFYGVLRLDENVSAAQIFGTALLSLFIVLQAVWQMSAEGEKNKNEKKQSILFFILCIAIFVLNGLTGIIAKAHEISLGAVDEISFTVISCALTALFGLLLLLFELLYKRKEASVEICGMFNVRPIIIMTFIGAAAYTGNFLHLLAANDVPASVQFPLVSGGVIVLSALVSRFIFKEKITKKEWISVVGAFISTVLFAF